MASPTRFAGTQAAPGGGLPPGPIPLPPVPTAPPAAPGETPPTLPPSIPSVPSLTTVVVTGEGTGVDLLPLEPSLPLSVSVTIIPPTDFDSSMGYESLQTHAPTNRRGYHLQFNAITDAQRTTMLTFVRDHKSTAFLWTAPDDSQRSWYVAEGEVGDVRIVPGVNSLDFLIVESKP